MNVRELRLLLKLSQAEFSSYFDIPLANVRCWEQQISNPPSYLMNWLVQISILEGLLKEGDYDVKANDNR